MKQHQREMLERIADQSPGQALAGCLWRRIALINILMEFSEITAKTYVESMLG